ncbi:MAG: ATP-binding protein [Planctomycetota bacterium]|nr:ATP-binding protein [Planctomycetota bacterium]
MSLAPSTENFGASEGGPELLRTLLDCSNDSIYFVTSDGKIFDCNNTASIATGFRREELLSMSVRELQYSLPDKTSWLKLTEQLQREGSRLLSGQHVRKDGTRFPVEVNANYVNVSGESYMIAIARDVTARKQLEEELLQSRKLEAVGRLAGGMAHDFNNILTVIRGYTSLLLDDSEPEDDTHWKALEIHEACERATNLITQLLAFGRRATHNPIAFDLNKSIERMSHMLDRALGDEVELVLNLEDGLPAVIMDPVQFEQIILNLALNAKSAMSDCGSLLVETKVKNDRNQPVYQEKQQILLTVSDTGKGMDPETLEKCFEPFYTTKDRGEGLGLSTVYGIVTQSQGQIKIESRAEQGTQIYITLPATSSVVPADSSTALETKIRHTGTEKILIVEDDSCARQLIFFTLSKLGYHVLQAANGEEGLEVYQKNSDVDLVITDILMPKMNGVEMSLEIIKLNPEQRHLFISGFQGEERIPELLKRKGNFLPKPLDLYRLSKQIRSLLKS